MALTVLLSFPYYTSSVYALKCDSIDHLFTRMVTQNPLPASNKYTASTNFWLDLGMSLEQITITGVVDEVPSYDGSNLVPDKAALDSICRLWWVYTNQNASLSALPQLTFAGNVYGVSIKQADFKFTAGEINRWVFSIIFAVGFFGT